MAPQASFRVDPDCLPNACESARTVRVVEKAWALAESTRGSGHQAEGVIFPRELPTRRADEPLGSAHESLGIVPGAI